MFRRHFAWRPHLDRDPLFNPFVPSERRPILDHVAIEEAYGDEVPSQESSATPEDTAGQEGETPTER